MVYLTTI